MRAVQNVAPSEMFMVGKEQQLLIYRGEFADFICDYETSHCPKCDDFAQKTMDVAGRAAEAILRQWIQK